MSEGFWRRRFAADPTLIGREITLDGRPITVIGVVPSNAQFTPGLSFNLTRCVESAVSGCSCRRRGPAGPENARGQCGVCRFLQVVGRMKPGVSIGRGPVGADSSWRTRLPRNKGTAAPGACS